MAKIFNLSRKSDPELEERRRRVLSQMRLPSTAIRGSVARQFVTCGKKNCRCRHGAKHGPFFYLVQCMRAGVVRKRLLKSPSQVQEAREAVSAYTAFQLQLEELSQINAELLRRGLTLQTPQE